MRVRTLAAAAGTLMGITTASAAHACVNPCDFDGVNINMGNLQIGQMGTLFENLALYPLINDDLGVTLAYGYIPTDSEVIFTYNFTGLEDNPTNVLTSGISYNYTFNGNTYQGFSNGDSLITGGAFGPGVLSQGGSINGSSAGAAGVSQVFATAALPDLTTGNTTVSNYARGLQEFTTTLLGYFDTSPPGTVTIGYQVEKLSPLSGFIGIGLPLPGSLPMALLATAGMFAFAHAGKKRKAVA